MSAHTPFDAKQDWTNPYCQNSSNDPMVDALLGNAYHVVRTVYCNLGNLKLIYDFLNQYGMVLGVQSEAELKALTTKAKYARIYGFSRTGDRQVTDYLYVEGDRTGIIPDNPEATGSWITVATSGSIGGGTSSAEGAYIPWVYANGSATGGETTVNVPDGTVGVPFIIINGDMQHVGRGFEFNADNLSVTLAQPLEEGDEVVFLLTGVPAVPDNPNVNDWVQINWLYNNGAAVGGEQVIAIPYTFQSIPAVYKNGLRLYKGLTTESYTVDLGNQRIFLTEPLATNDRLIVQIGGEAQVLEISDHTLQEVARATNVKDSEVILSTNTSQFLNGKKVIFDVVTQHCYALPTLPSNVYITSVNEGQLTYSPGNITVDLLPLVDSKENIVAVIKDIYSQSTGSLSVGHGSRTVADNLDDIKHSANYPDLQAAIDATNPRNDLLITAGTYPGEYTSGNANLIGVGYGVNFTPGIGKTSLTLSESSRLWQYRHAENFLITGSVDVPQGIGITFGGSPTPNLDGRWNFKHIAFDGLDIGVFKPKGNIGNTYQHCSYLGCNYGHKAESDPNMHVGADTWRDCHFAGINTYGIYLNGSVGGPAPGGGLDGLAIRDCIMEASPGGGIYFKGNGLAPVVPPTISNVWFELVATADTVTVDGVPQAPRQLKLENVPVTVAEGCYFNNIELINSTLVAKNCRFDNASGVYDINVNSGSQIIAHDLIVGGSVGPKVFVESVSDVPFPVANSLDLSLRGTCIKGRIKRLSNGQAMLSESFAGAGPWQFLGTSTVDAISVTDGVLSDTCGQIVVPAGATVMLNVPASLAQYYTLVWGASLKLVSGDVTATLSDSINIGSLYTSTGEWVHTFGVGQLGAAGTVKLTLSSVAGCVLRMSDVFVAQFANKYDAYNFANSRMSIG